MIHNNIPKISPLGTDVSLKAIIVNYGKTPFAIILQFTEMRFSLRLPLTKMVLILSESAQSEDQPTRRALYLPKVWSRFPYLPDPADFVRSLKQKGG